MRKLFSILFIICTVAAFGQESRSDVANYINANINTNGTQKITGTILNTGFIKVLNSYWNTITDGTPLTGSGTTGYHSKFTGAASIGNANLKDSSNYVVLPSGKIFIGGHGLFSLNLNTGDLISPDAVSKIHWDNDQWFMSMDGPTGYKSYVYGDLNQASLAYGQHNYVNVYRDGIIEIQDTNYTIITSPRTTINGTFVLNDGTQANGYVLTSDVSGNASWAPAATSGWGLTGNSGTTAGTNFEGTTDSVDFVTKTNNHERFRVKAKEGVILGVAGSRGQTYMDLNGQRLGGFYVTDDGGDGTGNYLYMAKNNGVDFYLNNAASHFNMVNQGSGGTTIDDEGAGGITFQSNSNEINYVNSGSNIVHNDLSLVASDYTAQLPNKTGTQTYAMLSDIGGADSAVVVGYGLSKSVSSTKITLKADTTSGTGGAKLATQYYVSTHAGGGSGWSITGNSGLTAGTNFIGNTDSVALSFKTNNIERMRILPNGYVGIGTQRPDTNYNMPLFEIQKNTNASIYNQISNYSLGSSAQANFYFAVKDTQPTGAGYLGGQAAYGYLGICGPRFSVPYYRSKTILIGGGRSNGLLFYADNGDIDINAGAASTSAPAIHISGANHPFSNGSQHITIQGTAGSGSDPNVKIVGNIISSTVPSIFGAASQLGTEDVNFTNNTNGFHQMLIRNSSTGASALTGITLSDDLSEADIYYSGLNTTPTAWLPSHAMALFSGGVGGLNLIAGNSTSGVFRVFSGGYTSGKQRINIDQNGAFQNTSGIGTNSYSTRQDSVGFKITPKQYVTSTNIVPFEIDNSSVAMLRVDLNGNVELHASNTALATSATNGFYYPPSMGGTPSGTPALKLIGAPAMCIDTTGNKIWAYYAGGWNNLAGAAQIIANRNESFGASAGPVAGSADNIAIGDHALTATTGSFCVGIGTDALRTNTSTGGDVAIGYQAKKDGANTGTVAVGYQALKNCIADNNTALGYQALLATTSGSYNFASGFQALSACTTGSNNTAVGALCLYNSVAADKNTGVGYAALGVSTTGSNNTATGAFSMYRLTSGRNNTADGYFSREENTTGTGNVSIGNYAAKNGTTGSFNTVVGDSAAISLTTGGSNTLIGYNTDISATLTNATAIGANASVTASNTLVLGSSVNVAIGSTSPTYKLDVTGGDEGLATVGKTYRQHFGSTGDMFGDATLSSGTVAITISGLTTADRAFCQLISASGTLGASVLAVCTSNTLTITSVVAAGTINTLDNSVYTYHLLRPY